MKKHALLIGINDYHNVPGLHCVACTVCFGAGTGQTTPGVANLRIGAAAARRIGSATSASALPFDFRQLGAYTVGSCAEWQHLQ